MSSSDSVLDGRKRSATLGRRHRLEKMPDEDYTEHQFNQQFGFLRTQPIEEGMGRLQEGWLGSEEMDVIEIWKVRWKCKCSEERVRIPCSVWERSCWQK